MCLRTLLPAATRHSSACCNGFLGPCYPRLHRFHLIRRMVLTLVPVIVTQDLLWKSQVNEEVKLIKKQEEMNARRVAEQRAREEAERAHADASAAFAQESATSLADELEMTRVMQQERELRRQTEAKLRKERLARLKAQEKVRCLGDLSCSLHRILTLCVLSRQLFQEKKELLTVEERLKALEDTLKKSPSQPMRGASARPSARASADKATPKESVRGSVRGSARPSTVRSSARSRESASVRQSTTRSSVAKSACPLRATTLALLFLTPRLVC